MAADGTPKVTDFGLAKLIIGGGSLRTQTGDLLGTPSYMAPEQAGSSRPAGSGRRPTSMPWARSSTRCSPAGRRSRRSSRWRRCGRSLTDEPVSPSRLRPRLPRDLETICLKCLHKEPARRYATRRGAGRRPAAVPGGRPILARRSTPAERAWRWCRRNPWPAAAARPADDRGDRLDHRGLAVPPGWPADPGGGPATRASLFDSRMNLFESLTAQAQARRFSHHAGQRFESLDALDRATVDRAGAEPAARPLRPAPR